MLVDDQAMFVALPFKNSAADLQSVSIASLLTPMLSAHLVAARIPEHSACSLVPALPEQLPAAMNLPLEFLQIYPAPYLWFGEVNLMSTLIFMDVCSGGIQTVAWSDVFPCLCEE
ncbi:hypothetical protein FRX31_031781 [Thalictrum thalictroides]|uniref:Uncharacterized protein n=1 Tax=Thalictrum thalictroides TaxID=46969 RepID=A0A7J6V2K4_THATH|nr:hypothetical protein FRX31_031781 [Thalictrum thalictroides]